MTQTHIHRKLNAQNHLNLFRFKKKIAHACLSAEAETKRVNILQASDSIGGTLCMKVKGIYNFQLYYLYNNNSNHDKYMLIFMIGLMKL